MLAAEAVKCACAAVARTVKGNDLDVLAESEPNG